MFKCLECGRRFRTVKAAERAASEGCPDCGGVDIDIDTDSHQKRALRDDIDARLRRLFRPSQPKQEDQP